MDSLIFDDYKGFKASNDALIDTLESNNTQLYLRYSQLLYTLDYLYELETVKNEQLDEDEEFIFKCGLDFIFDQFLFITTYLEKHFDNNVDNLVMMNRELTFLFLLHDVKSEMESKKKPHELFVALLDSIESHIEEAISKREKISDEKFKEFDDQIYDYLTSHQIELNTTLMIFNKIYNELT